MANSGEKAAVVDRTTETDMGGHKRYGGWGRGGHGGDESSQWPGNPSGGDSAPRMRRPIFWIVAFVGLAVWSLLAWVGYVLVDPVLGWVAANAGPLVDGGKGLATAAGAGKEVGSVVDSLNIGGFLGQAIALLRTVVKPGIIVLWAIGALALVAAPAILPRLGRMLLGRRH